MGAQLDVVEDRHPLEEGDVLEGPGQAERGAPGGRHAGHVAPLEDDPARLRAVEAGDAVEQAGLAGAVRPDDGGDAAPPDAQVDAGEGLHAAEGQGEPLDGEDDVVRLRARLRARRGGSCVGWLGVRHVGPPSRSVKTRPVTPGYRLEARARGRWHGDPRRRKGHDQNVGRRGAGRTTPDGVDAVRPGGDRWRPDGGRTGPTLRSVGFSHTAGP